jgi:hypothetical protein
MYALIDKNEIKVGPREYSIAFFRDYLQTQNVEYSLPYEYSSQDAMIINDDIKIVKVAGPVIPDHNSITEQLAGPYWDITNDPITGHYEVADRDIIAIKNDLIARVADKRYTKEISGCKVTIQNTEVSVSTDRNDRNIWIQAATVMGDGVARKFKFDNGIWLELILADIQTIIGAIATHVQSAFEWEASKVTEIESANDKIALATIGDSITTEV